MIQGHPEDFRIPGAQTFSQRAARENFLGGPGKFRTFFSHLNWKSKEITLGAKNIKVDARANAIAPLLDIWQKLATCVAFTKGSETLLTREDVSEG